MLTIPQSVYLLFRPKFEHEASRKRTSRYPPDSSFRFGVIITAVIVVPIKIVYSVYVRPSPCPSFWIQIQKFRVPFPALPDFLRISGSGTGSIQHLSAIAEVLVRNSNGSVLGNRDYDLVDPYR
jgi:hypothetical protein